MKASDRKKLDRAMHRDMARKSIKAIKGDTTMSDELIREILGAGPEEFDLPKIAPAPEPAPEPEPEPEPTALVGHSYVDENGHTVDEKPFAEVFGWTPAIDHLVKTYHGYDHAAPMEGYIMDKDMIEQFSLCESLGLKQNITGPTGCGKTQLVEWYAAMCGRPYMRIAFTESFDKAEIFGQVHITDGDTNFVPGVLPRTFDKPYMVLKDELTRAPAGALMVLGTLLDRRELSLPEMKGEGIEPLKPCEGWSVCAADNTKGNGDGMDKYIASNVQDSAFLNRFDIVHEMDYLQKDQEFEFLRALGMGGTGAEVLSIVSHMLHIGNKDGTLTTDFSPRNLQAIAKLVAAGMTPAQAFKLNYLSRVSECETDDVREVWRGVTGESL